MPRPLPISPARAVLCATALALLTAGAAQAEGNDALPGAGPLRLGPVRFDPPTPPPMQLSDPQATPSARALLGFLVNRYGRQILSAQQTLADIAYVEGLTGKTPAIGAFDLMEYSPSRIERGADPERSAERWIGWAGRDGIVSLSWHWNAPADLIDSPTHPWWRGFYTEATRFDLAAALADTASARYRLLLRDIDAIAVQLRKFEARDVPVLWRPLHEAAGGWFWWGAKGPAPFKALWRLLYERLVHVHGLHHLIWVYTHEPGAAAWYPGDDVVDVVSRDLYAGDPADAMRSGWRELHALYGDRKLLALSESGTLPDPEAAAASGVWWSWFSVWSGRFIRDVDPDHLRRVYRSELVLTRDELPDWRTAVFASGPFAGLPALHPELYPNPAPGRATLRVDLPAPADVQIEIFDVLGRRVRAYAPGFQPAGPFETTVEPGTGAGVYVVRVVAGASTARRKLVVTQ